jgi:hypothetical protein
MAGRAGRGRDGPVTGQACGRARAARLGVLVATIALVGGCAGAFAVSSTAPAVPTVAVTMTIVCEFGQVPATSAGDIVRTRGMQMTCSVEGSDPRVTGTQTGTLSIDEHPDGSAELWHSYQLLAGAGGWVGAASGLVAAGYTTHRLQARATGTGAYEGLVLEFEVVSNDHGGYDGTGTIGPG